MCGRKVGVATGSIPAVKRARHPARNVSPPGTPPLTSSRYPPTGVIAACVQRPNRCRLYGRASHCLGSEAETHKIELAATIPGHILSMGILDGSALTAALVKAMQHLATLPEYNEIGEMGDGLLHH